MDSKQNLTVFLFWVLWPLVSIRFIGYFAYKNTNYNSLNNLSLILNAQWNICYGIWNFINLSKVVQMQASSAVRCSLNANLMDLNYEVVLIFGMFPALTLASFVILALLCSPCLIYTIYTNRRETMQHRQVTKQVVEKLLRFKYEPELFKN